MNAFYTNSNGKKIGEIYGDALVKKVKKSKHLLRKWDAWGIDKQALDDAVRRGVNKIRIRESEEQIEYSASLKELIEKGIEADFGHSKQVFLPRVNFNKEKMN